jgi:hypothetical protein
MCICAAPRTPLEGVNVFGHGSARDFQQLQSFFEDRGVIVAYRDVEHDQIAVERMLTLSGQGQAVVTQIGQRVFVGFNPAEIETALP